MTKHHKRQPNILLRIYYSLSGKQPEPYYGPRKILPGLPQVEDEKSAKPKKQPKPPEKKADPPAKHISSETLAANLINRNLSGPENRGADGGPASTDSGQERPPMPVRHAKRRKRKKPLLKRLFRRRKPLPEQPAIIVDKPKPETIRELTGQELLPMLNSLGIYLITYLVVYLAYQFATVFVASYYKIDSVLYYYELYFPAGNYSELWTRFNIIAITFVGPLVSLLIAIILLRGILPLQKPGVQARIFFLWTAFHGAAHFLGAFVAGIVTDLGFGYVANWLYMNVFFKILISLIFLFILTIVGFHSTGFALETIEPAGRRTPRRAKAALLFRFLLPWMIGAGIISLVKIPDTTPQHANIMVYDSVIIASMGFLVTPVLFRHHVAVRPFGKRSDFYIPPRSILVFLIALAVLVIFRLVLSHGLHFMIKISIDMGLNR